VISAGMGLHFLIDVLFVAEVSVMTTVFHLITIVLVLNSGRKRQPPNKKLIRRKGRPEFSTIEIQTVKLGESVPYIPDSVLPALIPDEPLEGWEKYGLTREDVDNPYQIPFRKYCYYCGKQLWNDLQFVRWGD